MRKMVVIALWLAVGLGALTGMSPAPEAGPPCIQCPDVPVPSDCPPCYEWVPESCRQCAHCERIKGCKV